jgi:hypothetical protein
MSIIVAGRLIARLRQTPGVRREAAAGQSRCRAERRLQPCGLPHHPHCEPYGRHLRLACHCPTAANGAIDSRWGNATKRTADNRAGCAARQPVTAPLPSPAPPRRQGLRQRQRPLPCDQQSHDRPCCSQGSATAPATFPAKDATGCCSSRPPCSTSFRSTASSYRFWRQHRRANIGAPELVSQGWPVIGICPDASTRPRISSPKLAIVRRPRACIARRGRSCP